MAKKYKRFYLVEKPDSVDYRKLESDLPFGAQEGVEMIKKSTPQATRIKHLNKKAIAFLELI